MENKNTILATDYYVKSIDASGNEVCIAIADDNVFTRCPMCGKEHQLKDFINDIAKDKDFDLYATSVFCEECSRKYAEEHKAQ